MQFTTPIQDFGRTFPIAADAKLLALGSCFAEVVGRRMGDRRLDILLNPTGVLYNPRSLFNLLDIAGAVARGDADALSRSHCLSGARWQVVQLVGILSHQWRHP